MRLLSLASVLLFASSLRAEGPPAPRRAPELVLQYVDGKSELLSAYRGSVVMIEFLHTTCMHCQAAAQVFSKLNTEYGAKGFKPLGVAWNEMSKMLVPDFIKLYGVNYPIAYEGRDKVLDFLGYSVMQRVVVPQIVWIDRKGMIRSQTPAESTGGEEMRKEPYWRDMIVKLTAETDGAAKKTSAVTRKAPVARAAK